MKTRKKLIIIITSIFLFLTIGCVVFGAYTYKRSVSVKDVDVGSVEVNNKNFINYADDNLRVDTVFNLLDIVLESKTEYSITKDTVFQSSKSYYVLGTYSKASVIVGETVTADTYYEDIDGGYNLTKSTKFESGITYYTKTSSEGYTKTSSVSIGSSVSSSKYYEETKTYTGVKSVTTIETKGTSYTCTISTDKQSITVNNDTVKIVSYNESGIKEVSCDNTNYELQIGNDCVSIYVTDTTKRSNAKKIEVTTEKQKITCSATKDKYDTSNIYLNQLGLEFSFTTEVAVYVRIHILDAWHGIKVYSSNKKDTYNAKDQISGESPFMTKDDEWYYDAASNTSYLKVMVSPEKNTDGSYKEHTYVLNINEAYFYESSNKVSVYKEYVDVEVSFTVDLVQANRAKEIWGINPEDLN